MDTATPVEAAPPPEPVAPVTPPAPPRAALVIGPLIIASAATPIVALVMMLLGIAVGYTGRPFVAARFATPTPTAAPAAAAAARDTASEAQSRAALMQSLVAQTRHFKGNADAPVTILVFADFQCPYCGRFQMDTEPQIEAKYLQAGLVRIGYQAAEASECADDQQAFWPYHDKLYASQNGENQGAFSKNNLKKFAADLGLDAAAFGQCLDSGKYSTLVTNQTSALQQLGVSSTPTFLVNGQPIVGAEPFASFQQLIEQFLK
ncbi:MAG: thioredoxin domain-containing protein [Chloroflexi bacterium]|nr:thioredoxin domain-containing protein [Chloroflexota bacterium]